MALARLTSDATVLADHRGGPQSAPIFAPGKPLAPPCTEPFCGSFHWPKHSRAKAPPPTEASAATDNEEQIMMDLPNVIFYPSINPPLTKVRLRPSWRDHFDWWNVPNAVHLVIHKPSERNLLLKILNKDMVVVKNAEIQGQPLRTGLQLIAVRPKGGRSRVNPFLGNFAALSDKKTYGKLPLEVTFGRRGEGNIPIIRRPKLPPGEVLNVKRLDMVLAPPEPTGYEPKLEGCTQHKSFAYEVSWEIAQQVKTDPLMAAIFDGKKAEVAKEAGVPWEDVVPEQMFVFDAKGKMYGPELANKVAKLKEDSYPLTYRYVPPKCETLDDWMAEFRTKPSIPPEPKPMKKVMTQAQNQQEGANTAGATATAKGTPGEAATTNTTAETATTTNKEAPTGTAQTAQATLASSSPAGVAALNNSSAGAGVATGVAGVGAVNAATTLNASGAGAAGVGGAVNTATMNASAASASASASQLGGLGGLGNMKLGSFAGEAEDVEVWMFLPKNEREEEGDGFEEDAKEREQEEEEQQEEGEDEHQRGNYNYKDQKAKMTIVAKHCTTRGRLLQTWRSFL